MAKPRFTKILRGADIVSLAVGAIIGWGWIVLSGGWLQKAGTLGAACAFLLGGVMILFVGLAYAELTPALPKCGGEHVFSLYALGYGASYVCTWALILGYAGVAAFEACALPSVVEYILPGFLQGYLYEVAGFQVYATWAAVGSLSALGITYVNYRGIRQAASLQKVLTGVIALAGVVMIASALSAGETENLRPLFKGGGGGVLSVAVATPFLLMGFDVIPQAAEEIDLPPKKIGGMIIASILVAVVFYIMVIFAVSLVMPDGEIAASSLVTADAVKKAWGGRRIGGVLMVIGGMAGILSSWNAFLVGGSRVIYAMADTGMIPAFWARLHPKHRTPGNAVLLIGGLSCAAPFFGKAMMGWMSNAASFAMVTAYLFVAASFLRLRYREPDLPRPYRVPRGKLVGGIALALTGGMLVLYLPGMPSGLTPYEWAIVGLWALLGLALYRQKSRRGGGGGNAPGRGGEAAL